MRFLMPFAAILLVPAVECQAQGSDDAEQFSGPHLGAEAGATDHHFIVTETGPHGSIDRNVTKWGERRRPVCGL